MHNPAPVLENDTHKLLWDFVIPMDHLISTRKPEPIIISKKKKNKTKKTKKKNKNQKKTEFAKLSTLLSLLITE